MPARKLQRLQDEAVQRTERRSAKKETLGRNAVQVLAELGYARTSLRDIAEQTGCSVGLIHYYFESKADLIAFCVRLYKKDFVDEVNRALASAPDPGAAIERFIGVLAVAVRDHASLHRLWYDIRSQSLFEPVFDPVVDEIEADLIDLVAKLLQANGRDPALALPTYTQVDGLFQHYLRRQLRGHEHAVAELQTALRASLT